jgi:lipoate-protein ligase A
VSIQTQKSWRFIPPFAAPGSLQMAIDHWLLEQYRLGLQSPCLRFYTWSPVAISLGYHQRRYPQHWSTLTWQGHPLDLIRRPTGGRAVLHQGDLTYALITGGLTNNRLRAYQHLCQFLIQGWQRLGVELTFGTGGRGYIRNPNCFGTATAADLVMANGYKLIGSAQLYRDGCVLQHGSMRLTPDPTLFESVFEEPLPRVQLPVALQIADQRNRTQAVINALSEAAEQVFGVELRLSPLSQEEVASAMLTPSSISSVAKAHPP